ncbi:AAA family ATPase [Luedemannella flava]
MISCDPAPAPDHLWTWGIALATDDPAHRPARLAGRTDVLSAIEARLDAGGGVVLTGPSGIGKTAILDAVGDAAHGRGECVLRVAGAPTERWVSFSALSDLLTQLPPARRCPARSRTSPQRSRTRPTCGCGWPGTSCSAPAGSAVRCWCSSTTHSG